MKKPFASTGAVPEFDAAPSVVLIAGAVEFFVDEAASLAEKKMAGADTEVLRFDDDASAEAISDALLNRSLFSPRRLVRFDVSRLLGSEVSGELLDDAVEAWGRGNPSGKREAFRKVRALLSALDLAPGGDPDDLGRAAARKARRRDDADVLVEILRELPEERGGPAVVREALKLLLSRPNDGTVALVTAAASSSSGDLVDEIAAQGLVLLLPPGQSTDESLARLARARAKDREVTLDPDAIQRLRARTDGQPESFASELDKLLDWAGPGGRIRASDVSENVLDESSEDLYGLYDAIGRRDAADALGRVARLFSGRPIRAGEREIDTDGYWPVIFLGMLTAEIRRMLLVRAKLEEDVAPGFDASMSPRAFEARFLARLAEPVAPFGRSPFQGAQGQISPFLWYKVAQRAARYEPGELARSLGRAAEIDVLLKSGSPPLETLVEYVGELIAGKN